MPKLVVVVEVFVTQRKPEHALPDQGAHFVLDQMRLPAIAKARGEPINQPDRSVCCPQQQAPTVRGHRTAVERSHNLAPVNRCKAKQIRGTLCRHRRTSLSRIKSLLHNNFLRDWPPMHLSPLRNPG